MAGEDGTGVQYAASTTDATPYLTGGGKYQDNDYTDKLGNVLMLIPQKAKATEKASGNYSGNYMIVDIVAYNLANEYSASTKLSDEVVVYSGKLLVKLTGNENWEQGKRYIYTLVFGKDGGGENPDNPDDPDPVFVSVKYEVTVDDFIPVDNIDDIDFKNVNNESND